MTIRLLAFTAEHLQGQGENGADVTDIEGFKAWVQREGNAFRHSAGVGDKGDMLVYAWLEKPTQWNPIGDARVLASRKSLDKKWVEITTDGVRVFPNKVAPFKVRTGGPNAVKRISNTKYGKLIAKAYRR